MAPRTGNPIRLRRAAQAMAKLIADPEDTRQVFHIVEALSGNAHYRLFRRVQKTPEGRRLLDQRPSLVDLLEDRDALRRMPAGSLGRAYLEFVESEGVTAGGLVQASETGTEPPVRPPEIAEDMEFLAHRMRDTHDVWHAVTGYRGDLIGEACLLAFTFTQTWNPGIGFIVAVGFVLEGGRLGARGLILDGLRRGWRARFLPSVAWEELLPLPLTEVRQRLGVDAAPVYTPLRSTDRDRIEAALAS